MAESPHPYVALLRAVNVGGRGALKMADLRASFEALGMASVSTYIQTGNVVFTAADADTADLASRLERHLESSLGYRGRVFVFTPEELKRAAANNPFNPKLLDEVQRCHLMFLSAEPDAARRDALMGLQGDEYRFAVHGKVLYYAYPAARAYSRRSIDMERVLGVTGTARTWKVVDRLIELVGVLAG